MSEVNVKPADLLKIWAMPRDTETRQITLRVSSETFYKIQALERMFPARSRNELIGDLLTTALNEFEDGLPVTIHQTDRVLFEDPYGDPVYDTYSTGPKADYRKYVDEAISRDSRKSEAAFSDSTEVTS